MEHDTSKIYIVGRNAGPAQKSLDDIGRSCKDPKQSTVEFLQCDLSSLQSVLVTARQFRSQNTKLHLLIANGGIMAASPNLTSDGYEVQFGTNHLGHALLIKLLRPCLVESLKDGQDVVGRVVFTSSLAFAMAKTINFSTIRTGQSMLVDLFGR